MEKLNQKYDSLCKAFKTLVEAIHKSHSQDLAPDLEVFVRDSLIQRFEYTTESLWKYLKLHLERVGGFDIGMGSPKQIVKIAGSSNYISEEERIALLYWLTSRNLTSHVYREEVAQEVAQALHKTIPTIKRLIERLKPE